MSPELLGRIPRTGSSFDDHPVYADMSLPYYILTCLKTVKASYTGIMSETGQVRSTWVTSSGSDQDEQPQLRKRVNKETGWGHIAMLDKIALDFFQICDSEGKGFITRTDMRRLHKELPLTSEELENVFDSLDLDKNGYLTLGEFSYGFTQVRFAACGLDSGKMSVTSCPTLKSSWPVSLIKSKRQNKRGWRAPSGESIHTHDTEICRLYEEMEQQIINEKDRAILKLERQCRDLHSEHKVSRLENVKLKMTNEELSRELEYTCQELVLTREQLGILQEQASQLQQDREMEMYRITEGLQREKQSLMKQLDLLREVDKEEVTRRSNRKTSSLANDLCSPFTTEDDGKLEVDGRSERVAGDSEGVNDGVDVDGLYAESYPSRRTTSHTCYKETLTFCIS